LYFFSVYDFHLRIYFPDLPSNQVAENASAILMEADTSGSISTIDRTGRFEESRV